MKLSEQQQTILSTLAAQSGWQDYEEMAQEAEIKESPFLTQLGNLKSL